MRTLELPALADPKELEAAVHFQAQENIPMPLDQAVLDYHKLADVETPEGQRSRVMLVAARRDMVERLLAASRAAGLRPEGIDLSAFAMIRALDIRAEEGEGGILYVNVGGMTNLAVADQVTCRFTRVVSGGLDAIVNDLAERRGLTVVHARQWLAHVGLEQPIESIEGDPAIVGEARHVLADGVRRVADEVRNSLDYYRAQESAVDVSRAVVTGPAVAVGGFADQLAMNLGMPVQPAVVGEATAGALAGLDPGLLTVAAGLAVEERASA
jgi:type IV pilus assembly protein PilM